MSKFMMPKIETIKIDDRCQIYIKDKIYGSLVVMLLDDNGCVDEKQEKIIIPGYDGQYFVMDVPKTWIGKKVLVKYERKVDGIKLTSNSSPLYYVDLNGDVKTCKWGDHSIITIKIDPDSEE